ncbi:helix-turn-helix transcriptional regulator [Oxalobacteraceae bacterium A2-2]
MSTNKQIRLENLRKLISEFKTAEEVARRAGTAPMYLSQILNGAKSSTGRERGVGDSLALKLETGCEKPPGWMDVSHDVPESIPGALRVVVADPSDPNFYHIPKVQLIVRAGFAGFETVPEIYDGSVLSLNKNWVDRKGLHPSKLVALSVTGDSMEPNLYDGDIVIVNTADTKMKDGEVFVFNYDGEAVIKRLVKERGEWWLFSDNADQTRHRPKGCRAGECLIIGRVVRRETDRI